MTTYTFTKNISLLTAFQKYMKANDAPLFNGCELTGDQLTLQTTGALSQEQLTTITTLVTNYVEPPYDLNFSHTESIALHSHYTNDPDLVVINGRSVVQTLIFTNRNSEGTGDVLDSMKTVLEFNSPNLQSFLNVTSGSVQFEIFDITRNYQVELETIDISPIVSQWNTLAQTGATNGNTVYKSFMCNGLMDKTTDYDCIYQFRLTTSNPDFNLRMNGLQWLFYTKSMSTL
jgi:hypothetical protein